MRQETCGTIVEYDEDVTATEATKAEGGALGMRLDRFGESIFVIVEFYCGGDIIVGGAVQKLAQKCFRRVSRKKTVRGASFHSQRARQ